MEDSIKPNDIAVKYVTNYKEYREDGVPRVVFSIEQVQQIVNELYHDPEGLLPWVQTTTFAIKELMTTEEYDMEEIADAVVIYSQIILAIFIPMMVFSLKTVKQFDEPPTASFEPDEINWQEEFKNLDFPMPNHLIDY